MTIFLYFIKAKYTNRNFLCVYCIWQRNGIHYLYRGFPKLSLFKSITNRYSLNIRVPLSVNLRLVPGQKHAFILHKNINTNNGFKFKVSCDRRTRKESDTLKAKKYFHIITQLSLVIALVEPVGATRRLKGSTKQSFKNNAIKQTAADAFCYS